MNDSDERKLDHRLRALLALAARDASVREQEIHVFVRFSGPVQELAAAGARVGSVAGDIATAALRVGELEAFARSPAVRLVEAAGHLHPGGEPTGSTEG